MGTRKGAVAIDLSGNGRVKWSFKDREAPCVAVVGGRVYLGQFGQITAVSANIGQRLSYEPAANTDTVFATASQEPALLALRADTGQVLWSVKLDTGVTAPSICRDVIYLGGGNGRLMAFDTADGKKLWEFKADDRVQSPPRDPRRHCPLRHRRRHVLRPELTRETRSRCAV